MNIQDVSEIHVLKAYFTNTIHSKNEKR